MTDEFNSKLRQLTGALEKLVQKKETLRSNTVKLSPGWPEN